MSWAETVPAMAVSVAVVLGPGLVWGAVLGLKRLQLLALAGPFSITAAVLAAEAAAVVGLGWSLLPLAAVTIIGAGALWLIRRRFGHLLHGTTAVPSPSARWRTVLLCWGVAAVPLAGVLLWIFGAPENIAQSHDNIFHLNALKYISETSNASSRTLGYLGTRSGTFYPAGWHAVVSLLVVTLGTPIAAAINVTNLVLLTGIWGPGCLYLISRVLGERTGVLLVAAVLSTAFSSFPYLLLEFGVVYPFLLSVAMLPVLLGAVIELLKLGAPAAVTSPGNAALLLLALPGLALAHPSTLMGLLALSVPLVLAAARVSVRAGSLPRWPVIAATAAFLVAGAVLWMAVRPGPGSERNWARLGDAGKAVSEVVFHAPAGRPIGLLVTVLAAVGAAVVLYLGRYRWTIGVYVVAALLYIVGNWKEAPGLRSVVAGVWYNDFFRISAMLPPAALLVSAVGGLAVATTAATGLRRLLARGGTEPRWAAGAAAAVLTAAGLALVPFFAVERAVTEAAAKYRFAEDSWLLTVDELALLNRLADQVPADSVVVGDPLTGAALSYAYAGRETLLPYAISAPTPEGRLILEKLDEMTTNPEVCPAVKSARVGFVLDFGTRSVHPGETSSRPGLRDLSSAKGFELVDREGGASLYRVAGCG